jgi:hypothetical protein
VEFLPILGVVRETQGEECMRKFRLIGFAAVLFSVLVAPVMARHLSHSGQSIFCATREAGNPHSKYCDYLAWSGWRRRGGWDSRLDNACLRDPGYIPGECSFNAQGQSLFSAHPPY